jgi:hypothetical protein
VQHGQLSSLTKLKLSLEGFYDHGDAQAMHSTMLAHALSRHTRLQHVDIRADLHAFVPWLAGLPGLTCLVLHGVYNWVREADLQLVGTLSGLSKLTLGDVQGGCRALCMETVRKLPLLEEVQLGYAGSAWTEEEVLMLLPPPERLRALKVRVRAVGGEAGVATVAGWGRRVMQQFECYDVDMVCR